MRKRRAVVALIIVFLPGLLLAPAWRLAGLGAGEDDVLYYFPSGAFFHEAVHEGEWPWLNPLVGLGRPYVADPQSAVWYPFTWLFVLMPPLWAYPLSLWIHYSFALWGAYRLLRDSELDWRAALFGGVAFAFCGFMLAHRAHFAMQHAAAWTPFVFWRLRRFALSQERDAARGPWLLTGAAFFAALQCFAGHVQIAALTALGTLVYLLGMSSSMRGGLTRRVVAVRWVVVWLCAAGLYAVQWLPTVSYLALCTRVDRTYLDFVENSWNPASALNLVLPMFFGQRTANFFDQPYWGPSHQCEQFGYAGIITLVLAALAVRAGWRADVRRRPWVVLLGFAALLALGLYGPLCPVLYLVPGASVFRVPARALLLVNLALVVLAAVSLHDLLPPHTPQRVRLRAAAQRWTGHPLRVTLLIVGVPLLVVAASLPVMSGALRSAALAALSPANPAIWIPVIMVLATLVVLRVVARRWRHPGYVWLCCALIGIDLGVIGWTIDVPRGARCPGGVLRSPDPQWFDAVREDPRQARLWVVADTAGVYTDPLHKLAANTNVLFGVPALTDYGPLQPVSLQPRFAFKPWGVSENRSALLDDTNWMRLYNVGWVLVCEDDVRAPQACELVATTVEGWRLYRNPDVCGIACFADPSQPGIVRGARTGLAEIMLTVDTWPERGGDRSEALEARPLVVVSQLALPGWQARVSDPAVTAMRVDDALLGLRVPPGRAVRVHWRYRPPGLTEGALISGASACLLVMLVGWQAWKRRRTAGG